MLAIIVICVCVSWIKFIWNQWWILVPFHSSYSCGFCQDLVIHIAQFCGSSSITPLLQINSFWSFSFSEFYVIWKKNNEKLPNFETPMISICYFVFPFAKKATCDAFVYLVYSWYHKYPILSHSKHTLYTYSHCHKKTIPFHIESFHSLYHWDGIFFLWILFEMTHTKHTHIHAM